MSKAQAVLTLAAALVAGACSQPQVGVVTQSVDNTQCAKETELGEKPCGKTMEQWITETSCKDNKGVDTDKKVVNCQGAIFVPCKDGTWSSAVSNCQNQAFHDCCNSAVAKPGTALIGGKPASVKSIVCGGGGEDGCNYIIDTDDKCWVAGAGAPTDPDADSCKAFSCLKKDDACTDADGKRKGMCAPGLKCSAKKSGKCIAAGAEDKNDCGGGGTAKSGVRGGGVGFNAVAFDLGGGTCNACSGQCDTCVPDDGGVDMSLPAVDMSLPAADMSLPPPPDLSVSLPDANFMSIRF
jgi:hypothetical protein